MKKAFIYLSTLFIITFSLSFTSQQEENGAEILFEKTVHNYGEIYKGGNGNCEFRFTNTGNEPLILTNVRSSCGCTVPKWPREPIMPGKSNVIKVRYDTNRMGAINKQITVTSNAKTTTVILKIKGKVLPKPNNEIPSKQFSTGSPVNN